MVPLLHALLHALPTLAGSCPEQLPLHWMVPTTPQVGLLQVFP